MIRNILAVVMMIGSLAAFSTLTGCNTIAGAGTDVERGGEAIHDTAKDAQQKM
jgi:entericidin B